MSAGTRDPEPGRGRVLGHDMANIEPTLSGLGYTVYCQCGETFRARRSYVAVERWGDHRDEERANRGR